MSEFLKNFTLIDLIQSVLSLAGIVFTAYMGYLFNVKKIGVDSKQQTLLASKTAEQEFRDDLIKQLEDSSARLDRQMQRLDEREKRNAELLLQIDAYWGEKAELKAKIATLEAELVAANRKNKEQAAELEKFERKVFYIAKSDESPKS